MASVDPKSSSFPGGFDLRHRLKLTQEGLEKDLCPKQDVFAVGGPQGSIKLLNVDTLLYVADFKAHSARITGLEYCHTNEHWLWSTSIDNALSYWDSRKAFRAPVYRILSPNNCSFTACGLNYSDEIVAAATEPYGEDVCLYLWDIRKLNAERLLQTHMDMYTDSHNGEITQDGLICLFDVSKGNEDDALDSVLNTGSSVSQIGYFGPKLAELYCLTHIETVQLWDTVEGSMTTHFTNPREENGTEDKFDYFVNCMYCPTENQLYFVGGTNSGRLHVFHVKDSELEPVCPLMGGHTSIVRCLQWDYKVSLYRSTDEELEFATATVSESKTMKCLRRGGGGGCLIQEQGQQQYALSIRTLIQRYGLTLRSETLLTGGEDSIISCWRSVRPQTSAAGKVGGLFNSPFYSCGLGGQAFEQE
ncbi:WD repeat-containing protein 89 [Stylophora pistillata]|uniref:WD repeat-containing protein 89 n=1 Tax=Stylophora pistillata TaxID=50429 RepID=A0A2B4RKK3_STYPI|nr:WD repeat-containing protein 89 [Stylophora pistillata]